MSDKNTRLAFLCFVQEAIEEKVARDRELVVENEDGDRRLKLTGETWEILHPDKWGVWVEIEGGEWIGFSAPIETIRQEKTVRPEQIAV